MGLSSGAQRLLIKPSTSEPEAGRDVGDLEVGQLINYLLGRKPVREQIEHVDDANPHAANARTASELFGIHRDAVHQFCRRVHEEIDAVEDDVRATLSSHH